MICDYINIYIYIFICIFVRASDSWYACKTALIVLAIEERERSVLYINISVPTERGRETHRERKRERKRDRDRDRDRKRETRLFEATKHLTNLDWIIKRDEAFLSI